MLRELRKKATAAKKDWRRSLAALNRATAQYVAERTKRGLTALPKNF